jgi:hypothetical protein
VAQRRSIAQPQGPYRQQTQTSQSSTTHSSIAKRELRTSNGAQNPTRKRFKGTGWYGGLACSATIELEIFQRPARPPTVTGPILLGWDFRSARGAGPVGFALRATRCLGEPTVSVSAANREWLGSVSGISESFKLSPLRLRFAELRSARLGRAIRCLASCHGSGSRLRTAGHTRSEPGVR